MRYDQAAILTDLDGTLFNSRGDVSKADRAAIREFIAGAGSSPWPRAGSPGTPGGTCRTYL